METNDVNFPVKCIICENTIQNTEVEMHGCFASYINVYIDENRNACPMFEDETIMNSASNRSTHTIEHPQDKNLVKSSAIHEDIEELLIAEIRKRREIWDYKLPITSRSRDVIASHWKQISKELNGILTPDAALKKWRYLKDSYMRIRNDLFKKRSGSAASKPIKWKWYNHLNFLHDVQDSHSNVSNIIRNCSDNLTISDASSEISEIDENTRPPQKRRKKSDNSKDMLETLSAIVREPITINTSGGTLQPKSENIPAKDNINYITALIGNVLREMADDGFSFGLKLLQIVTEKRNELRNMR